MFIKSVNEVEGINEHLKPYEKYIEKYTCNYGVSPQAGIESLTFFHKETCKPYLIVCIGEDEDYPAIYENLKQDDLENEDAPLYEDNLIKDMNKFILAIRKCVENENVKEG